AFSISPDCAVYKNENKDVTGTDASVAEFFVEFKNSADDDPFTGDGYRSDSRNARRTVGQIATYVSVQMDSQYRTHTFFVLIIKSYARLMRWDRSGAIFSEPIYYNEKSELLEFFEAYDKATPEAWGCDQFVTKPTPGEIDAALGAWDDFDHSTSLLVVSLHNQDLHPEPHRYVIISPRARPSLPIGRSTRMSVAYDLQRKKRVFMKDSWRIVAANTTMEGQVYQMLNQRKVRNVPLCVDFCDVGEDNYHKTQTESLVHESWVPQELQYSFPVLRHHRLVLDNVGKSLENFTSSHEMVRAVRAALVAHKEAYFQGVLHRDISSGNILITDDKAFDGGLLIDWDQCRVNDGEEGEKGHRRSSCTGTWQFMAADLVYDPTITQTFIHDLESTFYVL
ncbi:hypothetical protein BJY52DRAFT_1089943, partial [Lactarius psammicola]